MRDPFTWSLPLGRLFGIKVRVHLLFFVFVLVMWLRATGWGPGAVKAILVLLTLTFVSVLLHELGHCYAARLVDGDARDILLWPLGGLAFCEVPSTPRAHLVTAAGGPAVNVLLCLASGAALATAGFWPNFDPRFTQAWRTELASFEGVRYGSEFALALPRLESWQVLVAQLFWINWFTLLLNVLIIGFPLDGGQMFQALLWPRLGYRLSMLWAITAGFVAMVVVGIFALWANEVLVLCLALFIYQECKRQWIILETGGEDSVFGYDFSQGYTSLEKNQPLPRRRRRPNALQRWLQRRAARKVQREQERQLAEERRMDELLEKIQRLGKDALTDEEHRFLKRVADKYRNRN